MNIISFVFYTVSVYFKDKHKRKVYWEKKLVFPMYFFQKQWKEVVNSIIY